MLPLLIWSGQRRRLASRQNGRTAVAELSVSSWPLCLMQMGYLESHLIHQRCLTASVRLKLTNWHIVQADYRYIVHIIPIGIFLVI